MKITSINCKHTVKNGEIAVNLDEEINQDIVNRLAGKDTPAYYSMINGETTVLKITARKRKNMGREMAIIYKDDIQKINVALSEIPSDIKEEESASEIKRKNMLNNVFKNTGLPLDCEE